MCNQVLGLNRQTQLSLRGVWLMKPIKDWLWKPCFISNIIRRRGEETSSGTFESKCSVMPDPCSRVQIDSCSPYKNRLLCLLFKVRTEKGLYESAKIMAHLILVSQPFGLAGLLKTGGCLVDTASMNAKRHVLMQRHHPAWLLLLINAEMLQMFIQEGKIICEEMINSYTL